MIIFAGSLIKPLHSSNRFLKVVPILILKIPFIAISSPSTWMNLSIAGYDFAIAL
jgi:hypothetical protein